MQKYKTYQYELNRNRKDSELKWTRRASKISEFGLDLEWVLGSYLSILKKKKITHPKLTCTDSIVCTSKYVEII